MSKMAPWTLYSIRAKTGQIKTWGYINLALFISIDELIKKIEITNWSSLGNASFEEIDQYSSIALGGWLHKIVFESIR